MLRVMRAMARHRGDDPSAVEWKDFVDHDIRRTARSNLSRKALQEVAEALLAHVRKGVEGVYDRHYISEKREALIRWHSLLRSIVDPAPATTKRRGAAGVIMQLAPAPLSNAQWREAQG
jgi:hypothetical protein